MDTTRRLPPWLLGARLVGTVLLIAALAVSMKRPVGSPWLGPLLIGLFFLVRVGSEWTYVLREPEASGLRRRSAILSTLLALGLTCFWVYIWVTGP
jgi:hypothetical protein